MPYNNIPVTKGILDIEEIYNETQAYDGIYYLSGPLAMIMKFKKFLLDKGIVKDNIIIDQW